MLLLDCWFSTGRCRRAVCCLFDSRMVCLAFRTMAPSPQQSETEAAGLSWETISQIQAYTLLSRNPTPADLPIRSDETNESAPPNVQRIGRSVDRVLKRLEALNSR